MKYLIFGFIAHGHNIPLVPLVESFLAKGIEVHLCSTTEFNIPGTILHHYPNIINKFFDDLKLRHHLTDLGLRYKMMFDSLSSIAIGMLDWIYQELAMIQFDKIIADIFCIWGAVYSAKVGVPLTISQPSFAPSASVMKEIYFEEGQNEIKNFNLKYGTNIAGVHSLFAGDYCHEQIVYTCPYFQFEAETLDSNKYLYVNPYDNIQISQPKPVIAGSIIYVSLGTVFNKNLAFFQLVYRFFSSFPEYSVIVSAGQNKNVYEELKNICSAAKHIEVKEWVDQIETLKKASVFITHCGFNGVREGLVFGTPMICYPQVADQPRIARRIVELNLGEQPKDESLEALAMAFDSIQKDYDKYYKSLVLAQKSFQIESVNYKDL